MKIVNNNKFFTLISVSQNSEISTCVDLRISCNDGVPRDFIPSEYKKLTLKIFGLKNINDFLGKIEPFKGEYIDIKELEFKKLDFWNESYQIGEFEFERYEEDIESYQMDDWVDECKNLTDIFYKTYDKESQRTNGTNSLISQIEFTLKKELENSKTISEKIGLFTHRKEINKGRVDISIKILNLINHYKEQKE